MRETNSFSTGFLFLLLFNFELASKTTYSRTARGDTAEVRDIEIDTVQQLLVVARRKEAFYSLTTTYGNFFWITDAPVTGVAPS